MFKVLAMRAIYHFLAIRPSAQRALVAPITLRPLRRGPDLHAVFFIFHRTVQPAKRPSNRIAERGVIRWALRQAEWRFLRVAAPPQFHLHPMPGPRLAASYQA